MVNNKIGLGTAAIGRPLYINIKRNVETSGFSLDDFRQKGRELLEHAYEKGVRYFDTAPGYGLAERLMIEWAMEKADASVKVATKWGYTYVADFDPKATLHEVKEHSLNKLNEQWNESIELLPFLTTYQIHSATFETGVLENENVLNRLYKLKNKHGLWIGITTTGANQVEVLKKALDIEVNGNSLFDTFQVTYNVFDQSIAAVAEEIFNRDKRLIIKEAMANGRVFPNENYPHYEPAYILLQQLATYYDVGVDAIALRFCLDSIPTYRVLSGASNEKQLIQNLKANDFTLEADHIGELKALVVSAKHYWDERKQLGWN